MSMKFLDDTGLTHFWAKIKAHVLQNGIFYGTCSTGGGTVAKVATVTGVTELKTGLTVAIKFTAANTVANPTLNVNSLGAKAIKRYGTTAPSTSAASSWNANSVVTLTYDGTYWMLHDWNNTTYSSMSVAEYTAGTSTSTRVITPARLKGAILTWAQEKLVSGTNIKTINNTSLLGSGDISISSGLEPLIGDTTNIVPLQVKNALREGRTVCLQDDGSLAGVDLDLRFTTWNGATDTVYSGAAIDIVASQTVAYYSGTYYLFELVGTVGGGWELFSTSLAEQSDIPTVPTNVSDFNNDAGYITSSDLPDEISDNIQKYQWVLYVNGTTAMLLAQGAQVPATFVEFAGRELHGVETLYLQVLNGAMDVSQASARLFKVTSVDMTTASVGMVSVDNGTIYSVALQDAGNGLVGTYSEMDVQDTNNLVTSISSSSTNTQYPSAKCVYDMVGNIESLLSNI